MLYLDSRNKGRLLSSTTRSALEALAINAAVAIEHARLYRETVEKARLEHEMQVAAEIQGKKPPAVLSSTPVLGILADQWCDVHSPAQTGARVNDALALRSIRALSVTLLCGLPTPEGRLRYCNAGHNRPLLIGAGGVRWLEVGGPPVRMFETARFDEESLTLTAGDRLIVYTDGVSEACNGADEGFGERRIVEVAEANPDPGPARLVGALATRVQALATGVPQSDDITALVIAYWG